VQIGRVITLPIVLLLLAIIVPETWSQQQSKSPDLHFIPHLPIIPRNRPLCPQQISLANYACARLPFSSHLSPFAEDGAHLFKHLTP
ncbi:hypothetical protein HN51_038836, partial [Arachis hypogaea]